jgi:tetratricopeptide (TPR) repeat protein
MIFARRRLEVVKLSQKDREPMNEWMDAETRVERAHDLYEKGRWAEAAAELQAAIAINPYNPSWHFNLGLTLEALEEYERACKAYRAALELLPNDIETLNCLGVNLTRLGQYAEALQCFTRIEKIDPAYEPAFCNRIVTYAEMGQHEEAEVMFYLAQQIKEDCPLCYYNIGNSLYARRLYDRAIFCWLKTIRLDPKHPHANVRIAETYWAKGDLASARKYYEAELHVSPADADVLVDFGELLGDLGQWDQAEDKFRRALELAADNPSAHFCLGELAIRRGQPAIAETHFRQVLQLDKDFAGIHARLAQALIRQGHIQEASKHLLVEIRRSADDPAMLQELGQLLLDAHLTRHANGVLRRLVELSPEDPYAQHNLAVSFFRMHRIDDGIRHCRKALKLRPEYPLALYNLALAHLQKGQIPRARRYAAMALTIAPDDEHVRQLSRRLGVSGFWTRLRMKLNPLRRHEDVQD